MQELAFLPGCRVEWLDAPEPEMFPAAVKIRTTHAAVSTGTEVEGLSGMASRTTGNYKPGYSIVGRVVECGELAQQRLALKPGQRVAAYGAPYVYHKTVTCVPWTLVCPLPDEVADEPACFCGPGAIAMHAVRRGQFTPGERVALQGMGILGQLAEQMLRAWGCRTLAIDIAPARLEIARRLGCRHLCNPTEQKLGESVDAFAPGGVDGVIVFTHTEGRLLDQAAELCRDRGRLVLVGGSDRVDVSRSLLFRKELDVLISRAGGPGRYDADYEKHGQDIKPGYQRWTEGRNVAEFVEMVRARQIDVAGLITHRFPRRQTDQAYALLRGPQAAAAMGVVFEFAD